jgi:hypothetical protein
MGPAASPTLQILDAQTADLAIAADPSRYRLVRNRHGDIIYVALLTDPVSGSTFAETTRMAFEIPILPVRPSRSVFDAADAALPEVVFFGAPV